jgi:hypothetical protein
MLGAGGAAGVGSAGVLDTALDSAAPAEAAAAAPKSRRDQCARLKEPATIGYCTMLHRKP